MSETFPGVTERELTRPVKLSLSDGQLNPDARGWSRHPLHTCNVSGSWPRKKKWNYWCVTNDDYLFSVTLSNIDYMGLAFAYFLDFKSLKFVEQTVMSPFGSGFELPPLVDANVHYDHKEMRASFTQRNGNYGENDFVHLLTYSPKFGGQTLSADLRVEMPPDHDTLNVVIPWNDHQYQFTSKQNCLPVKGSVQVGDLTVQFNPENSFGCLDFGRGIWPYKSAWNWASFSTRQNGHSVGVNLGGKWTDGTGFTENGLTVDGHLTKVSEDMRFEYDPGNFMKPWHIHTANSRRVEMVFTPFFERVAKTDALLIRSEVHQMIGRFTGSLVTETGETVEVRDAVGWAEEHYARW